MATSDWLDLRGWIEGLVGWSMDNVHDALPSDDIDAMATLVGEGLRAGALGFSTSRTPLHKAVDGELVPGTFATDDELLAIARSIAEVGHGVFQTATHHPEVPDSFSWMRAVARITGQPVLGAIGDR